MIENKFYSDRADLWCLGVLTYEFCVGSPPFESETHQETYKKIRSNNFFPPNYLSAEVKDFIHRLLVRDPGSRLSLGDCLKHPWIKKYNKTN